MYKDFYYQDPPTLQAFGGQAMATGFSSAKLLVDEAWGVGETKKKPSRTLMLPAVVPMVVQFIPTSHGYILKWNKYESHLWKYKSLCFHLATILKRKVKIYIT